MTTERHNAGNLLRNTVSRFLDHLEILQAYEQNAFGYYTAVLCAAWARGILSCLPGSKSVTEAGGANKNCFELIQKIF